MTATELQQKSLVSDQQITPEDFLILLAHATKKEKTYLLAHPEYILNKAEEATLQVFLERRLRHEPIAYIVGHKEFYGFDFKVTTDTLIPRPVTELIVELTLDRIRNYESRMENAKNKMQILDIGTGSGNIVISLAKTLSSRFEIRDSKYSFFATDISENALAIAKINAKIHNAMQNITFLHGDLLQPYMKEHVRSPEQLIITANLPYLSQVIYNNTSSDVHDFEPETALLSPEDGLAHYYRLLQEVKSMELQRTKITLFLEISPEQTSTIKKYITTLFPKTRISIHKDLAQNDRVVEIKLG